ncbi:MAG: SOS response-associated peptidase [Acidimicrobiales bacterium]
MTVCGRFASISGVEEVAAMFAVDVVSAPARPPRYNVAPSTEILAVTATVEPPVPSLSDSAGDPAADAPPGLHDGRSTGWELTTLRWGLIPSWAKDASVGSKMINARAESLDSKPSFRVAFARRRCLIPADVFYEWRRDGSERLAFAIARRDRRPMAFAGVWEVWRGPRGGSQEAIRSAAIVTTSANEVMSPIHDRMPVILEEDSWDGWLDPGTDRDYLLDLLKPAGPGVIEAWRVSNLVNKVSNRGPELIDPVQSPG